MDQDKAYLLPNELLLQIISFSNTTDTLYNFCLCSRWFCSIAQPILYRNYDQHSDWEKSYYRPFLRTLIDRPDLASQVKSLLVYDWHRDLSEGLKTDTER